MMTNFSSLPKSVSSGVLDVPPDELTKSDLPVYLVRILEET